VRRFPVIGQEGLLLLVPPAFPVVYPHLADQLREFIEHGDGEPLGTLGGLDPVAVLPLVFLELDVVQKHEDVGAVDLVEITEPGQVLGLMDGNDHGFAPVKATNMGLATILPIPSISMR